MTEVALSKKQASLEDKVARLRKTSGYPERPQRINAIETHMSWVFMTGEHAYKLKKPVRYEFLDFSTLEARRYDCNEELLLNRRLAPDVYLDVVPLTIDDTGMISVQGHGEIIDWLVKMRRLPAERMLDFMIRHKTLQEADVRNLAHLLASFYQQCPSIKFIAMQYRQEYGRQVNANLDALADARHGLPETRLKVIHDVLSGFLRGEAALFDFRVEQGRIVEGHGDLRPEHVCLEPVPVIFDCLEFNYIFRVVDVVDELSFLAMECDLLGAPNVGLVLFEVYGGICSDIPPQRLINFYKSYRACLRAKLAIWHIRELDPSAWPPWRDRANNYLFMAEQYARLLS